MKIEAIFRKIPKFKDIVLDRILFESKYPVLFTCKNDNEVYLFICHCVNSERIDWIGTRTTYDNLINLLENKITIRSAFLNVTDDKLMIEYDGKNVSYIQKKAEELPDAILPTMGEYMDAEEGEYEEEIAEFKKRNTEVEYIIAPRISSFLSFQYKGVSAFKLENYFEEVCSGDDVFQYQMKKICTQKVVLA